MLRYEIGADLVVKIFSGENTNPVILQERKPDGKPWKSKSEGGAWAEKFIADAEAHAATIELIEESPAPETDPDSTPIPDGE